MDKIFKVGEAAKYIGFSVKGMQKLDREKRLVAHRTDSNRRFYYQSELDRFLGRSPNSAEGSKKTVAYARVSSAGQKHDLKDQMDFIVQYANGAGIIIDERISDIGSGMNYSRPKWNALLKEVEAGKIGRIIVTYKDRFIRFGFDWFDQFCKDHGCEIVVLNNPDTSPDEEMTEDLISIIHVFSCRLYGLRRYKKAISEDSQLSHSKKGGETETHGTEKEKG